MRKMGQGYKLQVLDLSIFKKYLVWGESKVVCSVVSINIIALSLPYNKNKLYKT